MKASREQERGEFRFTAARGDLLGRVRSDLPQGLFAHFMQDPEAFFTDPSARVLKNGTKTRVIQWTLADLRGAPCEVVIKRFHYPSLPRRLGGLVLQSPAARSLDGALLLRQRGFQTPEPMAAFEFRNLKRGGTSYYISAAARDAHSLQSFWDKVVPAMARRKRLAVTRSLLRDLARLLSGLHSMGIYHRDLKGSNILIREWETDRRQFFLVDLDRIEQRRRLSLGKKIKNLLQVKRGAWSMKERIYFYTRYAELVCASKKEAKAFVRKVLAAKRRKNALGRGDGPAKARGAGSR
ncbi:MAG TPA: lipopolysaccharide kinase InaA family protein [Candidatus Binatia bacterium]